MELYIWAVQEAACDLREGDVMAKTTRKNDNGMHNTEGK